MRSLLLLLFLALPVQAQDRPPILTDTDRPNWLAIGRVNIGGFKSRGVCTGTLIAPDKVLTAAHCVNDRKTGAPFALYRVHFVAGWHRGQHVGTSTAKAIQLHPGYNTRKRRVRARDAQEQIGSDLALITLNEPLTEVTPARVAESYARSRAPVRMLGYRRDRAEVLSDYADCVAGPEGEKLMGLSCAVAPGTSGAPVFTAGLSGWEIVGVISSRVEGGGPVRALAAISDADALSVVEDAAPLE